MSEYVPIRLSTLRGHVVFTFNIYIPMKEKFILYVRNGDDIEQERLNNLKEKKLRQLFIESEAESNYQAYLDAGLESAINDVSMSKDDKAAAVSGAAGQAVDGMSKEPDSVAAYKMTEKAAGGLRQVLGKDPEVLKYIFQKSSESGSADVGTRHGINSAALAVALGEAIKLKGTEIGNLGVAGLLHDIGMSKIPPDKQYLLTTAYDKFSNDDWKVYKPHPALGAELLNGKEHINPEILHLINIHEERKSGNGFPKGITKMGPVEEVLALTCWYDRLVTCLGWSHKAAFENLKIDQLGNFDMKILDKFKTVLQSQGITNL